MAVITDQRHEQLLRAEKRLQEMEDQRLLEPFTGELLELIGIWLALTPYRVWPEGAKFAMEEMKGRAPVVANAYLQRLPAP